MDFSKIEADLARVTAYGQARVNFEYFLRGDQVFTYRENVTPEQQKAKDAYKVIIEALIDNLSEIKSLLAK